MRNRRKLITLVNNYKKEIMSHIKPTILVTGGAGYIGSHTVQCLQYAGYEVIILDNLICGHQDLVEQVLKAKLIW